MGHHAGFYFDALNFGDNFAAMLSISTNAEEDNFAF